MEAYKEKVEYENPLLSLKISRPHRIDNLFINWHYHREVELLLVVSGELQVLIEDEQHISVPAASS